MWAMSYAITNWGFGRRIAIGLGSLIDFSPFNKSLHYTQIISLHCIKKYRLPSLIISVEICSFCNNNATTSLTRLPSLVALWRRNDLLCSSLELISVLAFNSNLTNSNRSFPPFIRTLENGVDRIRVVEILFVKNSCVQRMICLLPLDIKSPN